MAGGVFVLKDPKTLIPMEAAQFATEDVFQALLANFPLLLSGEQIDPVTPRRWLLIRREKSVPSEDGGPARWSMDHLFVDQDGIPTLVEVKRQSDTRIRREVVGQMLDYAANAVVYWPADELRTDFEATCAAKGSSPEEEFRANLKLDLSLDAFWQLVKTNMQAGRIRMLFVADQIPAELRRIVEFLNEQMDPAEVLALELRQYEGEGLKTLVPVLFGQTQQAQQRKGAEQAGTEWTEEEVLHEIDSRFGPEIREVARRIADWMKGSADRVWFGKGKKDGSMRASFFFGSDLFTPIRLWTYGKVEIAFPEMRASAFGDEAQRRDLLRRISEVEGIRFAHDAIDRYPSISLRALVREADLQKFLAALAWLATKIREPA